MVKQIAKVLLLVALLAMLVVSSAQAFAGVGNGCICSVSGPKGEKLRCQYDKKVGQCINTTCPFIGECLGPF
jgi:hypothetical protein